MESTELTHWCTHCDCELSNWDRDYEDGHCESCRRENEVIDWIDTNCNVVDKLVTKHGWSSDGWSRAQTRSRYLAISREGIDSDGDEAWQEMTIRVSDHGSAYCREDLSLAFEPSGDDHTMELVEASLASPFQAD